MGYEIKMWICDHRGDNEYWQQIAMVELGVLHGSTEDYTRENIRKVEKTGKRVILYDSDGGSTRVEDPHGQPIVQLDPETFLEKLKLDIKNPDPYRRYVIAAKLLENCIQWFGNGKPDGLCVVTEAH